MAVALQFGVQTFFNYVTRKFQLTQSDEVLGNLFKDLLILVSVLELDDILNKVVAIRIFDQLVYIYNNIVSQLKFLLLGAFLEASLHHAAAVLVLSNRHTVVNARLENEVGVLARLLAANVVLILRPFRRLEHHE